jgi:hypothetical protein
MKSSSTTTSSPKRAYRRLIRGAGVRSLNRKLDRQTPSSLRFQRAAAPGAKPIHETAANEGRIARRLALPRSGGKKVLKGLARPTTLSSIAAVAIFFVIAVGLAADNYPTRPIILVSANRDRVRPHEWGRGKWWLSLRQSLSVWRGAHAQRRQAALVDTAARFRQGRRNCGGSVADTGDKRRMMQEKQCRSRW